MTIDMTIRATWNSIRVAQDLAEGLGHTWGKTELEPRDYSAAEIDESWWLEREIQRLQNRLDSLSGVETGFRY